MIVLRSDTLMLTTANIVIIRDRGLAYSGCFMAVRFNGVLAARLDTGEVSSFFFKPGEVVINVGRDPMGRGLCFCSMIIEPLHFQVKQL